MNAIRGAISVEANSVEAIAHATCTLLQEIERRNCLRVQEIVSVFFTLTGDLNADFPARAARSMGWDVPMLDMVEIDVPGSLPSCLRVLIHVRRDGPVKHAYLGKARQLRLDLEGEAE